MGSRSLIGYFSATNKPGHITPLGGNNSLYLKLLTGVQFEFEKKKFVFTRQMGQSQLFKLVESYLIHFQRGIISLNHYNSVKIRDNTYKALSIVLQLLPCLNKS